MPRQKYSHRKGTTGLNGLRMFKTSGVLYLGCCRWYVELLCSVELISLFSVWQAGSVPLKTHGY